MGSFYSTCQDSEMLDDSMTCRLGILPLKARKKKKKVKFEYTRKARKGVGIELA